LANLPRFIRQSLAFGPGYGEAMALRFPFVSDRFELAVFLVLAVALLFRVGRSSWAEGAALLPVILVAFKMGFTRQDGHDIDAVAVLALAVFINLPGRRERVAWSVLALAAAMLFSMALTSRGLPDVQWQMARAAREHAGGLAHLVTRGTDPLA